MLTASCNPAATSYTWTGGACAGNTGSTCMVTPAVTTTYTVVGFDASGASNTASYTYTVTVGPPTCTLTASPSTIAVGGSSTLTASCTPAATSYTWTGGTCAGYTGSVCTDFPGAAGVHTYTVAGVNAAGTSNFTSTTVTVIQPTCTLTANPTVIPVGGSSTLAASCFPAATGYNWNGACPGTNTTNICVVTPVAAGTSFYTVTGTGTNNATSPPVVVTVMIPPPPACTLTVNPSTISPGSSSTLTASCMPAATSYSWTGSCAGNATNTCTVTPTGTTAYTVTGINSAGTGTAASATVTVAATPTCTLSYSLFAGQAMLAASCTPGATSWAWSANTGIASTASSSILIASPTVTTTYSVTGSNAAGAGNSASLTITVKATPPVTTTPICTLVQSFQSAPSGQIRLAASCTPGATSWAWSANTGIASTASSSILIASPTVTTTYSVTGSNAAGAGNTTSTTVTVDPLLTVTKSGTGSNGLGIVTSSPTGINCGSNCSASYTSGTSVTLTATPTSGSYFVGWSGACSGAGSCMVMMDAAKNITATFKPVPFVATTTTSITATSATITTTITFNATDVGKPGAAFITSWAPVNGLSAFGILTAPMSQAMSVTTTSDNPYLADKVNRRQETLGTLLAATTNTWVLVQKTASGWQLVVNGQLIPYATGVLGDALAAQSILNNTDPTNLLGAQFCVGYGTSDTEMIASGRMLPVAIIPASNSTATTSGSCNVTDVVVEFYNTNLDNYFITADANEAAQIDGGSAGPGWSRTGNSFRSGGSASVCRFYGSYSPGPNSHFYTVDSAECQGLKDQQIPTGDPSKLTNKSWNYESLDFVSTVPNGGACPTGTTPVYRAYNNGYARGVDSNHRITSSLSAINEVLTRGWSNEGVVMCAPL